MRKPPSFYATLGEPESYDCTGHIGQLFPDESKPDWPMYSYDRPASILWNAIAGELYARGWNDEKIRDWLQSKHPRWALDASLGDALRALGTQWAKDHIEG